MKKDEQWYLDNLPCIKQLENRVKNIKKSIAEYTGLSTREDIPKPIREHYTEYKIPKLEEEANYCQLAIDMAVKGFILGQRAAKRPPAVSSAEEKLIEAIFGKSKDDDIEEDNHDK